MCTYAIQGAESSGKLVILHLLTRHHKETQLFNFCSKDPASWDTEIRISSFLSGLCSYLNLPFMWLTLNTHCKHQPPDQDFFFSPSTRGETFLHTLFQVLAFFFFLKEGSAESFPPPSLFITRDSLELFLHTYSRPGMRNLAAKQRDWQFGF